jgi:hypothetical protein
MDHALDAFVFAARIDKIPGCETAIEMDMEGKPTSSIEVDYQGRKYQVSINAIEPVVPPDTALQKILNQRLN